MYFILLFAASTLNTDVIMYSLSEEQTNTIMDPSNLTSSITITPVASDFTTESTCNLVIKSSCFYGPKPGTQKVSVFDIASLPTVSTFTPRKRRAQKSENLTSSPYLEKVLAKENVAAQSKKKKAKPGKKIRRKPKESNMAHQYQCIYCKNPYEDPPAEDWIQCSSCEEWCHEGCSDYESGVFRCDNCRF